MISGVDRAFACDESLQARQKDDLQSDKYQKYPVPAVYSGQAAAIVPL